MGKQMEQVDLKHEKTSPLLHGVGASLGIRELWLEKVHLYLVHSRCCAREVTNNVLLLSCPFVWNPPLQLLHQVNVLPCGLNIWEGMKLHWSLNLFLGK